MNPNSVRNNNIGYLCLDRQIDLGLGNKTALLWIAANHSVREFSYYDLLHLSNKAANILKNHGVMPGNRVMFLLPRTPALYSLFLGSLRLGANSCILFTSIGDETLRDRIIDSNTTFIVTNKSLLFKIERILSELPTGTSVFVIDEIAKSQSIIDISDELQSADPEFTVPETETNQPSHFHFTSGSTGKPKGVQHVHGAAKNIIASFNEVMQLDPDDLFWCTADLGWVTGVSYGVIGPLASGNTQIQLEGNFDPKLWMSVIETQKVNVVYSAPTVFRMLMQIDDGFYSQFNFTELKRIYCVGEPLNPVIVDWGRRVLKKEIYDTWFQTETGSIMIANRPGFEIQPGSMGKPLSYIEANILNEQGNFVAPLEQGFLCLKKPWASMFSEYMNAPQTYQNKFIGEYYSSGDLAFVDNEGYFWFVGRSDDVINTAGHLVSPFEVESALLETEEVLDVGVVGVPDEILFEKIIAFVVLSPTVTNKKLVDMKLKLHVSKNISSIAAPKEIVFIEGIPKTKSGKIMRRVLRSRYLNLDLGDLSTMEDY